MQIHKTYETKNWFAVSFWIRIKAEVQKSKFG